MKSKNLSFIILFMLTGFCLAAAPVIDKDKKDKSDKKEKKDETDRKDKFLDYFNLIPKAQREYSLPEVFKEFEGYEINSIEIQMYHRFSKSISAMDSLLSKDTLSNKSARFNEKLVAKQLFINEGDIIDPQLLSDNERFIRENTIYTDAIFILNKIGNNKVDILVAVQDNRHMRINFSASPSGITIGGNFYDFLGVSQRLSVTGGGLFSINNPYTFDTRYRVRNIAKSQIDLTIGYTKQNIYQAPSIELEKEFVAYNTKWAGFAKFEKEDRKVGDGFTQQNIEIDNTYNLQRINHDYWLARSFAMPKVNQRIKTMRFITSGRANIRTHLRKPENLPIQNYVDQQFFLASVGVANREWYGVDELYNFRTFNYVPKGINFAVLGGYEVNEFVGNRWYSGFTLNMNKMFEKFGYLQGELRYGAFVRDRNYEQITTQINVNYFTNRLNIGRQDFRQFIYTTTTLSYNRPESEQFSIANNLNGLRSNALFGTKSFVVNFESVFYTQVDWWQSRGNWFLHADLGLVTQNQYESIFDNVLNQAYGVGIRFQHIVTTIDFLELKLSYYPNARIVNAPIIGFNVTMVPSRTIRTRNSFSAGMLTDI